MPSLTGAAVVKRTTEWKRNSWQEYQKEVADDAASE